MMRATSLFIVVLFVAGCVSSEGAGPASGPAVDTTPRFDDATGALRVLVLDDELNPIGNATVGLLFRNAEAETPPFTPQLTTVAGESVFSNLQPGAYDIQVVALGFESAGKRAEVVAGGVTEVQIVTPPLPSDAPYYETLPAAGMVRSIVWRVGGACDTVVQPPLGTCLGYQARDVTVRHKLTPDWATIVDETIWIPNSAGFHQRAYVFATFPNVTDFSGVPDFKSPGHFEAGGKSPVTMRIERQTLYDRNFPESNHYGGDRGTRFRHLNNFDDVDAAGVFSASAMIDQPMNVYITIFHKEVAPPEFSALPDA
jgi:hypothetical protein